MTPRNSLGTRGNEAVTNPKKSEWLWLNALGGIGRGDWNPFTDPADYQQLEDVTFDQPWVRQITTQRATSRPEKYYVHISVDPAAVEFDSEGYFAYSNSAIKARTLVIYAAWRAVKGETDADQA